MFAQAEPETGKPKRILIIIPFRDKWELTAGCLASLMNQDIGGNQILVALVDNESSEEVTKRGIQNFLSQSSGSLGFRHLRYNIPFNFSKLNNLAVKDCSDFSPDLLFFVNNDIEFIKPNSIKDFITFFNKAPNPGAVGCTLLYPDHSIQHLFTAVGSVIVGSHPFKNCKYNPEEEWYQSPRPVGAVIGAALMTSRDCFIDIEGFDEKLPNSYQDDDFCMKLQERGRVNWTLPHVALIHHETQTRKAEHDWGGVEYMYRKWDKVIWKDPFYSSRISRWSEGILLTPWARRYPWRRWIK